MTTTDKPGNKMRFRSMCIAVGITEKSLYYATAVNPHFIASMMAGEAIPEAIANQLVAGFNELASTSYILSDFNVTMTEG